MSTSILEPVAVERPAQHGQAHAIRGKLCDGRVASTDASGMGDRRNRHGRRLRRSRAAIASPLGRHHVIVRSRVPRGPVRIAYALLIELPHFVMERKMLLGLKRRAERA
jgi:hypothetical protein